MRRTPILIVSLVASALLGPAQGSEVALVKSGTFTAAGTGFIGCLRAADNTNSASVCVVAHATTAGVRVVVKALEPSAALMSTSYFEEVMAPLSALSVTTVSGVPRLHLDAELPRTGRVVLDAAPMWTPFNSQAWALQANCGMSANAASDDGGATVSPPSYEYGSVRGTPVVNSDDCSFFWVASASGSWAIAAPTDESSPAIA
jgi:hypothetical protein